MMKRKTVALLMVGVMALTAFALPAVVSAACATTGNSATDQVLGGAGTVGTNCSGSGVNNILSTIVTILSILVGGVAVIMIIVAGFKYVASGGDSGKVSSAKNTLLYAIIGLLVAVLAQVLVNVVLKQGNVISNPCQYNSKISADDGNCKPPK